MNTNELKAMGLEFEDYNGWYNRDTWLVMLWLNNDEVNYRTMKHFVYNTNKLQGFDDADLRDILQGFHYGDEIDFNRVNLDEIRNALEDFYEEDI